MQKAHAIYTLEWGGKKLTFTFGQFALQTNMSCTVRYGDTVVLATAVISKTIKENMDYFPLSVDYEERLYAAGKIKGSRFIKREGRPSDEAILTSRMIDRAVRPLFPSWLMNEVQVVTTVLSVDQENDSDIPSLLAASAALAVSDIPWDGPIAGVRVGHVGGEWVVNPTFAAREKSDMDLVLANVSDRVIMVEAGAKEVPENVMYDAFVFGTKHLQPVQALLEKMRQEIGKEKITEEVLEAGEETTSDDQVNYQTLTEAFITEHLGTYLFGTLNNTKASRKEAIGKFKEALEAHLLGAQVGKEKRRKAQGLADAAVGKEIARAILDERKRVDGRALTDIRPLVSEVGILPRTHGSGLFSRGETQILSIATLGAPGDEQTMESMELNGKKRYMHHYNFPGFSVGEVKPLRGPGRREIGHGALAEKALEPVLPDKESFPYTIRVVSETLGSNGSSSMASVCGSTLALMDAGVPIARPVAGIAMGLASDEEQGRYTVLTDLQDLEDGKGGMDFKIAGSEQGITAIQMDTKTKGLPLKVVQETLIAGLDARKRVLKNIASAIAAPRPDLSPYAPRITTLKIDPDKIRNVIGPGGKVINEIIDTLGVQIDIEKDGLVMITSVNAENAQKALQWVQDLTREAKPGEIFEGTVTRIMQFGAFVGVLPGQEGLVHVSELAWRHVPTVEDVVHIGDKVRVQVKEIDDQGRINLSMKSLQEKPAGYEDQSGRDFGGGGHDRFGGDRSDDDRKMRTRRFHDRRQH